MKPVLREAAARQLLDVGLVPLPSEKPGRMNNQRKLSQHTNTLLLISFLATKDHWNQNYCNTLRQEYKYAARTYF